MDEAVRTKIDYIKFNYTKEIIGMRFFGAATAAALASTMLVAPAAAAAPTLSSAQADLVCTASVHFEFTPALTTTNTKATVTVAGSVSNCSSPNGSNPELKTGAVTGTGTATATGGVPCSLILQSSGSGAFIWSPGGESDGTWEASTTPPNITFSTHVASGPLAGDTVSGLPVLATPNLDCAVNGLSSLSVSAVAFAFR